MKELRTVWVVVVWIFETVWTGNVLSLHFLRRCWALCRSLSDTVQCPRGHRNPAYGVFECRCKALVEGWVFDRCVVCREVAGWTPCRTCGLPIRNPLL